MKRVALIILALFVGTSSLMAQGHDHHDHYHHHGAIPMLGQSTIQMRSSLGLGLGGVYNIDQEQFAPTLNFDYFRQISFNGQWATGGALKFAMGSNSYTLFGVGVRYMPIDQIKISALPSVIVQDNRSTFAMQTELSYEALLMGNTRIGPMLGYTYSDGDSLLSLGVRLTISFSGVY